MRKVIAVVLMVVLVLSLAGCSSEEIAMYSLVKEMSGLEAFEGDGTMKLSMGGETLDSMFKDNELKSLKELLKSGVELKYQQKQKKSTGEAEVSLELRANGEKDFKKVTTVIMNNDAVYVKLDDLVKFMEPYILESDSSAKEAINVLANLEYIKVDLNSGGIAYKGLGYQYSLKMQKSMLSFMDILKDSVSDYSMGMISKKGNGYEFKLESKDVKPIVTKLLEYLSNKGDVVFNTAAKKVESLSDNDYNALIEPYSKLFSLSDSSDKDELSKKEAVSGLKSFGEEVKKSAGSALEEMKDDKSFEEGLKTIDGSVFSCYMEKAGDSYKSASSFKIKYNGQLVADISENSTAKKVNDVTITKPSKSISLNDLEKLARKNMPEKLSEMRIRTSNGETSLTYSSERKANSKLNVIIKDGYTYMPLRAIGEMYGEKVGWDGAAYVEKNGSKVHMKGINTNGRVYVKLRDFEQIGYDIWWDEDNGQAVITKPMSNSIFY